MSGEPYVEGVAEVVSLLERQTELTAETRRLRTDFEPKVKRHAEATEELAIIGQRLGKLLDSMDLSAQGNAGFGGRMGWFLAEMLRQLHGRAP